MIQIRRHGIQDVGFHCPHVIARGQPTVGVLEAVGVQVQEGELGPRWQLGIRQVPAAPRTYLEMTASDVPVIHLHESLSAAAPGPVVGGVNHP